jgi:hypothetical protein
MKSLAYGQPFRKRMLWSREGNLRILCSLCPMNIRFRERFAECTRTAEEQMPATSVSVARCERAGIIFAGSAKLVVAFSVYSRRSTSHTLKMHG